MSSILDALKKIEQQKQTRRTAPLDLTSHILRGDVERGKRRFAGKFSFWIISLIAVAVLSVSLTLFFVQKGRIENKIESNTDQKAVKKDVIAASSSTSKKASANTVKKTKSTIKAKTLNVSANSGDKTKVNADGAKNIVESPVSPPVRHVDMPNKEEKKNRKFSLSGIGWQKDALSRYAVINGTAVGEGGSVDGASVIEIRPDSVKIRRDGADEEIRLGK